MFTRLPSLCTSQLRSLPSRCASNKSFGQCDIQISLTDDGKTIVMYHPETTFPYEHTKELPKIESKFKEQDSVLKVELREDVDSIMFDKDYTMEDLIRKSHVSRIQWGKMRLVNRRKLVSKSIFDNKDRDGI